MKPVLALALNEARGALVVWLWAQIHPWPLTVLLTALGGLAVVWILAAEIVRAELIAREHERLLADCIVRK